MHEAVITGEGFRFVLGVVGYERADATEEDANWLDGLASAELSGGRGPLFRARCSVAWTTTDLARFEASLRALLDDLNGTATLTTLEDQVELRIELTNGRGSLSGRIEQHALAALEFEAIPTDQSYLAPALESLRSIVGRFPARP